MYMYIVCACNIWTLAAAVTLTYTLIYPLKYTYARSHRRKVKQLSWSHNQNGVMLRNLEQEGMFSSQLIEYHLINCHGCSLKTYTSTNIPLHVANHYLLVTPFFPLEVSLFTFLS